MLGVMLLLGKGGANVERDANVVANAGGRCFKMTLLFDLWIYVTMAQIALVCY